MWTHIVLEVYQPIDQDVWPTEGDPAEWIEKGLVGYCMGEAEDFVSFIPLWEILWWRLRTWTRRLLHI